MNTLKTIIIVSFILISLILKAEVKEIPFSLDDRDKLMRTELKVESLRSEMTARFESMDKRFDQLFNFLWAIIGIFTTMVISVFGFAFWDRKLSLAPMKKENLRILTVLSDYAKTQPKLLEIMKNAGLM
ncbi:MAG: hypothetical protein NTU98_02595 [Bacteroidetes bacterium]|nr:hypothetical protein [Bacteroidota bacterium]